MMHLRRIPNATHPAKIPQQQTTSIRDLANAHVVNSPNNNKITIAFIIHHCTAREHQQPDLNSHFAISYATR